ncbi:MAG: hypothetical protein WCC92_12530 [Candidatus Korobacteraceae bacterium]
MTIEKRCLIELSDILGVEFTCHSCKGKTSPELESTRLVLLSCPLCTADWLLPQTEEEKALRTFLNVIKRAKAGVNGRGFSLRLHIASPDESEAEAE